MALRKAYRLPISSFFFMTHAFSVPRHRFKLYTYIKMSEQTPLTLFPGENEQMPGGETLCPYVPRTAWVLLLSAVITQS